MGARRRAPHCATRRASTDLTTTGRGERAGRVAGERERKEKRVKGPRGAQHPCQVSRCGVMQMAYKFMPLIMEIMQILFTLGAAVRRRIGTSFGTRVCMSCVVPLARPTCAPVLKEGGEERACAPLLFFHWSYLSSSCAASPSLSRSVCLWLCPKRCALAPLCLSPALSAVALPVLSVCLSCVAFLSPFQPTQSRLLSLSLLCVCVCVWALPAAQVS